MTNYTKSTNFATKDALASGNALKIVKGTEIDTEFNNIATAVATKANSASPTFTGTPTLPTGTIAVTQSAGNNTTAIATTAFVQAAIALLYPVGSVYTNASVSTNPGTLLGFGTWTAFGAGRVPVGFDSSNSLFDSAEDFSPGEWWNKAPKKNEVIDIGFEAWFANNVGADVSDYFKEVIDNWVPDFDSMPEFEEYVMSV